MEPRDDGIIIDSHANARARLLNESDLLAKGYSGSNIWTNHGATISSLIRESSIFQRARAMVIRPFSIIRTTVDCEAFGVRRRRFQREEEGLGHIFHWT